SHLLQYVSSVLGLAVLAIWFRNLIVRVPRSISEDPRRPRASWAALITISSVALVIGVWRASLSWHLARYYHLGYLGLRRTIGWFAVLYLIAGVLTLLSRRLVPEPAR